MAEKRKLPPRAGREPAAKRRVSEAATPQSSTSTSTSKKKAATPRAPTPPPPEPVEAPLPNKLRDGEGLPIRRERQPDNLSDKDYQSIAERFAPQFAAAYIGQANVLIIKCRAPRILGAIEEEMAERRHPRPILHQAEEDKTRTNRAEQSTQREHVKAWNMRRHDRSPSLRCHDLHR